MSNDTSSIAAALVALLPRHDAGISIERAPNRGTYETVREWIASCESYGGAPHWPSPEARQRAIDTDDVWVMQWYPDTPVGSYCVAAPTLAELLAYASKSSDTPCPR